MAEQKLTPGPWQAEGAVFQGEQTWYVMAHSLGQSIRVAVCNSEEADNCANAHLIAMCPSMLEYIITHAALGESGAILIIREALGDAANKAIEEGTAS